MQTQRAFIIASCLILVLGYLVYGLSVSNVFILDDFHVIKNNPTLTDVSNLSYHLQNYFNRSLFYCSLTLNYYFSGYNPAAYQWTNIVLHAMNAWLLFYFLCACVDLKTNRRAGVVSAVSASVVYLIHPIQSLVIHQVTNRSIMLCAFFYLLGLIFFVRYLNEKRNSRSILYLFLVAVCFFLSLGSKSTAVSFPLACILFYYWKGKRCARRTWGHLSVLLLIFFVSIILLISNSQVVQTTVLNGYSYFMTQIAVFVRYLWLIVFPFDIVPEYIVPIKTSLDFGLMIYLFFHLSVIVWSLKMVKEKRALGLGFLLGYITLLPSSSFMPRDNVMLVYRLYLPLIGVAVFLCACLDSIPRQKKYIRIGARIMFVLYLIVCLSQCIYQNVLLSDNVAMWQNIKERFPQSYIPDFNIGSVYLREGNVDGALTSFGESLNKGANDPKVFYNFATALQLKGKLKESLMYYRRAHTRAPYEKKYWIGLGNAYYLDNQFVQALYFYKLYIESYPLAADVYNNVFYCYSAMGDDRAALGAIAHAISVEEKRFYLMNQALCLSRLSEYENALAVLNHVQSVHGLSIDILFQKGVIAQTQQKYDQALMLYSDVLLRDAEHIGALNNSGVLLYQGGRFDEARQKWSTVLSIAPQDKVAIMNMKRLKNENVDR